MAQFHTVLLPRAHYPSRKGLSSTESCYHEHIIHPKNGSVPYSLATTSTPSIQKIAQFHTVLPPRAHYPSRKGLSSTESCYHEHIIHPENVSVPYSLATTSTSSTQKMAQFHTVLLPRAHHPPRKWLSSIQSCYHEHIIHPENGSVPYSLATTSTSSIQKMFCEIIFKSDYTEARILFVCKLKKLKDVCSYKVSLCQPKIAVTK